MKFWLFLEIILDVWPWVTLQLQPFREKLRRGMWVSRALVILLLLPYQLAVVWIGSQSWCTLSILSACRMGQYLLVMGLSLWLIRDQVAKIIFMAGMVMPVSMFVGTLAAYIKSLLPGLSCPYAVICLVRLGLTALIYPVLAKQWKQRLVPAVNVLDPQLWIYSWPLPVTVTMVTMLYTSSGIEFNGVSFSELLMRLCLLAAIFVMAVMIFFISRRTEQRIRMAEEVERNRLLLEAQKEQYDILAQSIRKIRRGYLETRGHMEKLRDMADRGDLAGLRDYVQELLDLVDRRLPEFPDQTAGEILGHYLTIARQEQIPVTLDLKLPEDLAIDGMDLGIVMGNLLENAIEASRELPPERRRITVSAVRKRGVLKLLVSNPYAGEIRQLNGRILSRKCGFAQPGVGLSTVWAVADKYGGELRIEHAGGIFTVSALLPEAEEE